MLSSILQKVFTKKAIYKITAIMLLLYNIIAVISNCTTLAYKSTKYLNDTKKHWQNANAFYITLYQILEVFS